MRVGRVYFAGDSAHTCNPAGGYGAMAGILDASGLADCLIGYYHGWCGEEILDLYPEVKLEKFQNYVNRRSTQNLNGLLHLDADQALENEEKGGDKFLRMLKDFESKPEETREFLLVSPSYASISYVTVRYLFPSRLSAAMKP